MTKSTNHHPAAKRGPRAGMAHKAWAQERMNRGRSIEQHLRGREKIALFCLLGAARAMAKPRKVTRPTKVAQAVGNAIWGIQSDLAARALRRGSARGG